MTPQRDYEADNYEVRRLRADDVEAMPALTLAVNGPDYIHRELYHPARLLQMNQDGRLLSVVAVHRDGTLVGHAALERPDLGRFAESGEAMVLSEHRHHHLLDRMRELMVEIALELGLVGVYGNAVTHHVFSQRTEESAGWHPTAIFLGSSPASAHRLENFPQRVTLISYFKYLNMPGAAAIHASERHRPMVERLLKQVGREVRFGQSQQPQGPGHVDSSYDPHRQLGVIRVLRPGVDTPAQVAKAGRALESESGAEVVYVELPLEEPASGWLVAELEREGFFFSGVEPRTPEEGDRLRLQRLRVPLDLALVQLEGEFARELLAYIAAERARVAEQER